MYTAPPAASVLVGVARQSLKTQRLKSESLEERKQAPP
jgi:hypothetical protein